jgi:hypothetical protein
MLRGLTTLGIGATKGDVRALFALVDADHSGDISYKELFDALRPPTGTAAAPSAAKPATGGRARPEANGRAKGAAAVKKTPPTGKRQKEVRARPT